MAAFRHVLVADDEASIRHVLTLVLSESGYEVRAVSDGEEALKELAARSYDVVISDVRMPKVDGMALLRQALAANPDLTFLVMSAYGSKDLALEAVAPGRVRLHREALQARGDRLRPQEGRGAAAPGAREPPPARGTSARRAAAAPAGPQRAAQRAQEADRPAGAGVDHHPDHRRVGHGQGAGRPRAARAVPARLHALRGGELRRDPRGADRVGALRARPRRLHRRARGQARALHRGRRRHHLPRRGGRAAHAGAGEAAARAAGERGASRRREPRREGGRARGGRHAARSAAPGGAGRVPRRSLLPSQRGAAQGAAAARAQRRRAAAGRGVPRALQPQLQSRAAGERPVARRRADAGRATRGRATCASWRTRWSARCCWPRAR